MEQHVWNHCQLSLKQFITTDKPLLKIQTLASVRSLIVNPSTSEPTISAILESLTLLLHQSHDDPVVIHLFSSLSTHRPHTSPLVFDLIRPRNNSSLLLTSESTRLAAESLSLLASLSLSRKEEPDDVDGENIFLTLCFRPCVPVRSWLLSNAERYRVRPHLLLTVLLGFTKDPYPYVRKVALDGLVKLLTSNSVVCDDGAPALVLVQGCYSRAVELLHDVEDCVRSAAVRAVSAWGQMLVASSQDNDKMDLSNSLFVQLCSMVRDMSVEVRLDSFDAVGKIEMVSDNILLQSLSKKVLASTKENNAFNLCSGEQFAISASSAAGAFSHGLEDEFYEVRGSACRSLRKLTVLSAEFGGQALNWLMDMLNDDSLLVRLQALETMYHMATWNCLNVQDIHMHMFLSTLIDNVSNVRSAARKILRLVKLPTVEMFKTAIDGIIKNLENYPQDEADVFSILFNFGRNHGSFVIRVIKKFSHEMDPPRDGKMGFGCQRVAALVVLAIAAPLSMNHHVSKIPPIIYSRAVTFLGRISFALSDVMNQHTLLAYLSKCSRCMSSATDIPQQESILPVIIEDDFTPYSSVEMINSFTAPDIQSHEKVSEYLKFILQKVDVWPLIQSGCIGEALRKLRICKEELSTLAIGLPESAGLLAFTLRYLRAIKLIAKIWVFFLPRRNCLVHGIGELDLLLENLEMTLREMRYSFIGFSDEEELYILELILLTCILRLSSIEASCQRSTLNKLFTTITYSKILRRKGLNVPSRLVIELDNSLHEVSRGIYEASCNPFKFKKLLGLFSLKPFSFSSRLKHLKAELYVHNNNSENPLPFVGGLPVGIPFEITLYNITSKNNLWLRMTIDEGITHFVFLDLNQCGGCDEARNITITVPFNHTPKAVFFTLRVCVGMECFYEDAYMDKHQWGPKRELAFLCQDVEVYLSMDAQY